MLKKVENSLNLKTISTIVFSVLLGILCYLVLSIAGKAMVEKAYTLRTANAERLERFDSEFTEYVNPEGKSCDSISRMAEWLKAKPGLTLYLYDYQTEKLFFESDGYFSTTFTDSESNSKLTDGAEYIEIIYKDVMCKAVLKDNTYMEYYSIVDLISLFMCGVVIFVIIFIQYRRLANRIVKLSKQVKAVTYGDTDREIKIKGSDEIGELSRNIDTMRQAIIEHYEMEQNAIKANNDLLTSISHDIRTPLTSIIGYSEMMTDERTTDSEELKKYASICKDKAYRLKELTDTMFRYFYVYGRDDTDVRLVKYDASQLFMQVLGENMVDLMQEGFNVEVPEGLEEKADIFIDIELFNRILENIFQNFKRYADKDNPIFISAVKKDGNVVIEFTNSVLAGVRRAESTKIGLKTCSKIMSQMNGRFEVTSDGSRFNQRIIIPLIK